MTICGGGGPSKRQPCPESCWHCKPSRPSRASAVAGIFPNVSTHLKTSTYPCRCMYSYMCVSISSHIYIYIHMFLRTDVRVPR